MMGWSGCTRQNPEPRRLTLGNLIQGTFIENGTVNWPGNIDIDPETLYERSVAVGYLRNCYYI
jgi:hypothetical protein